MNANKKKLEELKFLNKLKHESKYGSKCGLFNEHISNTLEHELSKYLVYSYLKREGFKVYVEPKWLDESGRGDLAAIKDGEVLLIEIRHTESKEKLEMKDYPYELISFTTKEIIGDALNNLPLEWQGDILI